MTENFEFLIRELGSPEQTQAFTADQAAALQDRLPGSLLEFWHEADVGMWAQGLYQFCTPDRMQGVLRQVCGSDQDFGGDKVAIYAFTAFAQLQ